VPTDTPERLLRGERATDNQFDDDEKLYRRFLPNHPTQDIFQIERYQFYPAMSVNRERYSEPHDVLYDKVLNGQGFDDWGVTYIRVKQALLLFNTSPLYTVQGNKSTADVTYTVSVEHHPEEDNYAHSEIRILKDGEYQENLNLPTGLKKQVRSYLQWVLQNQVIYQSGEAKAKQGT
jgi:hypothetical protein